MILDTDGQPSYFRFRKLSDVEFWRISVDILTWGARYIHFSSLMVVKSFRPEATKMFDSLWCRGPPGPLQDILLKTTFSPYSSSSRHIYAFEIFPQQMSLWVWVFCDPTALIVCLNKIALVCYRTSCISLLNYRRLYEFFSKCTSIKVHHGLKERAKVVKSLETELINLKSWLNCLCTWERLGVSEISWVFNYASQAPQSTKSLSNLLRNIIAQII